jgi:hypothetical protein
MAENKTKPTKVSVAAFLKAKTGGQQMRDSQLLVKLFKELTGKPDLVLYLAPYLNDKGLKAKLGGGEDLLKTIVTRVSTPVC